MIKVRTKREIQQIALEVLKDVTKFCDENNIRYWLSGGTLLGAIRHEGFIPWDEDVDIMMPRPDYEKFESLYNKSTEKFKYLSVYNNKNHWQPFGRVYDTRTVLTYPTRRFNDAGVCGVFVDVFPLDGLPTDEKKSDKFFKKQLSLRRHYNYFSVKFKKPKNPLKQLLIYQYNIAVFILEKTGLKRNLLKKMNKNAKKYKFEDSEFIGVSCGGYGIRERIEKKYFTEEIKVKFKDNLFASPKDYNVYLTNLYGNYMKLPPIKKRKTKHAFDVYGREGNMNIALIIAGGKGERMGQDIPKQFLHVENKPIIIYTLEVFEKHPSIDAIAVVCLDGWHDILKAYAKQFGVTKLKWVVSGGETGQQSIYNGLSVLKDTCVEEDIVLIHDAIRPLISSDVISDCIAKTMIHGSAVTVIPCAEAMLLSDDTVSSSECIDRNTLKRTQTPQGFKYGKIMEAHKKARDMGITNSVASCTLMIETGGTIHFSTGSEKNIKITTVEDIEIFKAFLSVKKDSYLK